MVVSKTLHTLVSAVNSHLHQFCTDFHEPFTVLLIHWAKVCPFKSYQQSSIEDIFISFFYVTMTMKMKFITLLLVGCCLSLRAQNGNQCAFDDIRAYIQSTDSINYYSQQHQANLNWWVYWRNTHPQQFGYKPYNGVETRGACPKARIIIPVAVHVIHNGGAENISQAQAQNAIDAMNEHYANVLGASDPLAVNTGIQFVLARFDKVQNALTVHRKPTQTGQLMGLKMASADTFINIWVVSQILDTAGNDVGVNGYATYPGSIFSGGKQGVVIRFNWFEFTSLDVIINSASRYIEHAHHLECINPFGQEIVDRIFYTFNF